MKRMTRNAKALFFVTLIVSLAMGLHLESVPAQEEHGHESPHGGQVQTLGDYHVEFVVEEDGEIEIYLSDKNSKPLSVKNVQGFINLKIGSSYKKLNLHPNEDATYLEAEIDLHEIKEFEAGVRLTIDGKKYSNVVFKYSGHDKMPHEQLKGIFPKAHEFASKHATLSAHQIKEIEEGLKGYDSANAKIGTKEKEVHLYLALSEADKALGAALMLNLMGSDKEKIHGLVGIDSAGKVIRVILMEHHEEEHHGEAHGEAEEHAERHDSDEHDAEHAAFLKQFIGKTAKSDLMVGKGIKAGEDAKASAAVATGVKKALLVWNEVKDHLSDDEHGEMEHHDEGDEKSKDHHDEH